LKTAVSDPKFWRFFFSANFVTLNSRILRTSRVPSRLIRPRPIDCNRGPEQPVKISRVWVRTSSFVLAKADGHSYTESLKSGGITFILLVLLEAAPARAAA